MLGDLRGARSGGCGGESLHESPRTPRSARVSRLELKRGANEAPEPQRSLFSWAEFMAEEPVKPKGRSRKPQPSPPSLFEWAFSLEQERQEQLVGAGC